VTNRPIDRRQFLSASGGGLAATSLSSEQADGGTPNIVFLMTDNHRWDMLGCAGNEIIRTPHIDALAARREVHQLLLHHIHLRRDAGQHPDR